jgi:hypothetical protein
LSSEAQDIFDNATAFDPGDRVLDDDPRTGEDRVDELLTDAQLFTFRLFLGCPDSYPPSDESSSEEEKGLKLLRKRASVWYV